MLAFVCVCRVGRGEPTQNTDERLKCAHGDVVVKAICACVSGWVGVGTGVYGRVGG